MYMLTMAMSLKCFVCIYRSCVSVLSVPMACGVLTCVNVVCCVCGSVRAWGREGPAWVPPGWRRMEVCVMGTCGESRDA